MNYNANNINGKGVEEILRLDPNNSVDWAIIKDNYKADDIHKVVIDGDTFTNYGDFQFVWEKSYVKSPERSASGTIDNLNSYATFVTPHLIINFAVMSIDDYRAIMRKDLERNEFVVECYDPIYNKRISTKMYFGTPAMAKLRTIARKRFDPDTSVWEDFIELVGVDGYTVELIGTNSDLDFLSVSYLLNPPSDTGRADESIGEEDIYKGQDVIIGAAASSFVNETFDGKYRFAKWNTSKTGGEQGNYTNGYSATINESLVLYAQWDKAEENILTFSYGVADPAINAETYSYETSRKVVQGKSIGILPVVETPQVTYGESKYSPYYNGNWYKTPIKADNSVPVANNELYWMSRDSSIYLIYDTYSYSLNLYLDGVLYQTNSIKYNTPTNLPQLVKSGYTFDGWYKTENFQQGTKFNGNMPPFNLTLYARWIKK